MHFFFTRFADDYTILNNNRQTKFPKKFIGAMPCSLGKATNFWLLANPLWTHDTDESRSKAITGPLSMAAASANPLESLLFSTQRQYEN